MTMNRRLARSAAIAAIGLMLVAAPGAAGSGTFVEPVTVLHTFTGPAPGQGGYFGWAVSELRDVDHDGVTDVIIGEPQLTAAGPGRTWVYSGRTGRLIYRFHGVGSDAQGYAIADAARRERRRRPDIVIGELGDGSDSRATRSSTPARTGHLIYRRTGSRRATSATAVAVGARC